MVWCGLGVPHPPRADAIVSTGSAADVPCIDDAAGRYAGCGATVADRGAVALAAPTEAPVLAQDAASGDASFHQARDPNDPTRGGFPCPFIG